MSRFACWVVRSRHLVSPSISEPNAGVESYPGNVKAVRRKVHHGKDIPSLSQLRVGSRSLLVA